MTGIDPVGQLQPAQQIGLQLRAQHIPRQVLHRAGLAVGTVVEQGIEYAAGALQHLVHGGGDACAVVQIQSQCLQSLLRSRLHVLRHGAHWRTPGIRAFCRPWATQWPMPVEQPVMRMERLGFMV
jgi:hypothetical protein